MSTSYSVQFQNQTSEDWKVALWWASAWGPISSVVWKLATCPASTSFSFDWTTDYGVLLGTVEGSGDSESVKPGVIQAADLGSAWKVIDQGSIQKIEPNGSDVQPNTIQIYNASAESATAGLAIASEAANYYLDLLSRMTLSYSPEALTLMAGLFSDAKVGDVVTDPDVGPIEISFPGSDRQATVTATEGSSGITLSVSYS